MSTDPGAGPGPAERSDAPVDDDATVATGTRGQGGVAARVARGEVEHPEVRPLDVTGLTAIKLGSALWVVAGVVLWLFRSPLRAGGNGWWLWVPVAALVLGAIGYLYCRRRASRLHQPPA